ncbi:MAG: transglycosylase SLT domain-containing protein [Marinilabiliaceae bacterium]|nr:transglycosylase SLT domain-containing protein [Marinilabiliaceae bacterium]
MLMIIDGRGLLAQTPVQNVHPHYPDWMYQKRLNDLDQKTPIQLDYNPQVQAYIDVYTVKRRDHLANIIGRSQLYFPLFEEYLARYNLPLELKYLAIVESALDPTAKSSSGAMGLWQFLYHASRMFDLKVDTYVDERCDPVKSTDAACRYLAYLYHNLNDWQLALAAYNGGLGVVQKAIERSGGKRNFWELQPYLPAPVRSYVPAFIAATYSMNNYQKHEIIPGDPRMKFDEVDTIFIHKSLTFQQVVEASGVSLDLIRWLNPSFAKDYIPVFNEPVRLFIPKENVIQFIQGEKSLKPALAPQVAVTPIGCTSQRERILYTVKKGEFFHKIAINHSCRISDIMLWNDMQSRHLSIGQRLVIWQPQLINHFFFVTSEVKNPERLMWRKSLLAKGNSEVVQ